MFCFCSADTQNLGKETDRPHYSTQELLWFPEHSMPFQKLCPLCLECPFHLIPIYLSKWTSRSLPLHMRPSLKQVLCGVSHTLLLFSSSFSPALCEVHPDSHPTIRGADFRSRHLPTQGTWARPSPPTSLIPKRSSRSSSGFQGWPLPLSYGRWRGTVTGTRASNICKWNQDNPRHTSCPKTECLGPSHCLPDSSRASEHASFLTFLDVTLLYSLEDNSFSPVLLLQLRRRRGPALALWPFWPLMTTCPGPLHGATDRGVLNACWESPDAADSNHVRTSVVSVYVCALTCRRCLSNVYFDTSMHY